MKARMLRLLLVCLLLVPGVAWAEDLKVEASLDRNVISLGETARLQVTVTGSQSQVNPVMPTLSGFLVMKSGSAQNTVTVNGVPTSSSATLTYVLMPRMPGHFTIPEIRVQDGGQTASSRPLQIEVTRDPAQGQPPGAPMPQGGMPQGRMPQGRMPQGRMPQGRMPQGRIPRAPMQRGPIALPIPQQPSLPPTRPALPGTSGRGPAFLTAEVDNPTPYVGQAVTYTVRFYRTRGVELASDLQFPDTTGFLREDLPPATTAERHWLTTIDGNPYMVDEIRVALFPTAEGHHEIGATRLNCRVQTIRVPPYPGGQMPGLDDDWDLLLRPLAEPQTLESKPISLEVRPLPTEGRPDDFTGAVGSYKLESRLEPATGARVGQALNLELSLSGEGNVNLIQAPHLPALPGFKVYDPVASSSTARQGGKVTGTRRFSIALVPTRAGMLDLPPLSMSYFDPAKGQWRTLTTKAQQIAVAPGSSQVATSGESIPAASDGGWRPLHATLDPRAPVKLAESRAFLLFQALPLVILGGAFLAWGPRIRLFRRAPRAGAALRRAQARLRRMGEQGALAELPPVLYDYLGEKLGAPVVGLRADELVERLRQHGVTDEEATRLEGLLALADRARYCPVQPDVEKARSPLEDAESLLKSLERSMR